jgi:hypothetical protein
VRHGVAQRRYIGALASFATKGCLPLEADGAGGRSCGRRLLLLGATIGRIGSAVDFKLEPPLMYLGGGMMASGIFVMSLASSCT